MTNLKLDLAKKHFEIIKSSDEDGTEAWSARDLMPRLGYDRWENFERVIRKAIQACENSGLDSMGQFRDITKHVKSSSGATHLVKDYRLTRYACYLIAQNGDSTKEEIALAQTYFALQTRRQEVAQENVKELERLTAREKLTTTEKKFSGVMFEQGIKGDGIARIRARGDKKLFGGKTTDDMKKSLGVPEKRPLADFLPTITIKAKDLATEMTTFKTKEKGLKILAPELAKYEAGNVLLHGKKLTRKEADTALATFYSMPITFVPESEILAKQTYALAENLKITYYDASFISVAKEYNATLITDNIKHHGKTKEIKVIPLNTTNKIP